MNLLGRAAFGALVLGLAGPLLLACMGPGGHGQTVMNQWQALPLGEFLSWLFAAFASTRGLVIGGLIGVAGGFKAKPADPAKTPPAAG